MDNKETDIDLVEIFKMACKSNKYKKVESIDTMSNFPILKIKIKDREIHLIKYSKNFPSIIFGGLEEPINNKIYDELRNLFQKNKNNFGLDDEEFLRNEFY